MSQLERTHWDPICSPYLLMYMAEDQFVFSFSSSWSRSKKPSTHVHEWGTLGSVAPIVRDFSTHRVNDECRYVARARDWRCFLVGAIFNSKISAFTSKLQDFMFVFTFFLIPGMPFDRQTEYATDLPWLPGCHRCLHPSHTSVSFASGILEG